MIAIRSEVFIIISLAPKVLTSEAYVQKLQSLRSFFVSLVAACPGTDDSDSPSPPEAKANQVT